MSGVEGPEIWNPSQRRGLRGRRPRHSGSSSTGQDFPTNEDRQYDTRSDLSWVFISGCKYECSTVMWVILSTVNVLETSITVTVHYFRKEIFRN